MARTCSRTGCARPAAATMSFGYGARTAWLHDLGPDRPPATYDLCVDHADAFVVPWGWACADRRTPAAPDRRADPLDPVQVWAAVLPGF